jgi:hypothetical protein
LAAFHDSPHGFMTLWASAAVEPDRATTPSTIAASVANRKNGYCMLSSGRFVSAPAKPCFGTLTMKYRIQFLDVAATLIREWIADARNAASALELVADIDWPPRAVTMRVLDLDRREVHSKG